MADIGILFGAPMVRALLDGRKTQTRRVLPEKYRGILRPAHSVTNGPNGPMAHEYDRSWPVKTPYRPGDRLWVRERLERANGEAVGYPADGSWLPNTPWFWQRNSLPSIHCPRRLSRLTLTVTDVRVERLQDISEADAVAEGIFTGKWGDFTDCLYEPADASLHPAETPVFMAPDDDGDHFVKLSARDAYEVVWEEINGDGPHDWQANPWVVAISFTVERRNIDAVKSA